MDDILCAWSGPQELLGEFLVYLNSQYPSIKFTLEVGNSSINFLDLAISIEDGSHVFGIYGKNTSTDTLVHGSSFCPIAHKFAAFNSLIHRLTQIPLSREAFHKEVLIIKHLAVVNDISLDVDDMVRRRITRRVLDSTTSLPRNLNRDSRKRWIGLPFLGKFSSQLGRVLRPFGFRPVFYNPTTIKSLFVRLKDPIPLLEKSGVYRVACGDCNGVYIGETGRQLKTRIAEHKKAWEKGKMGESAFADHLIENNHSFREGSEVLLHRQNNFFKRMALEHIEIVRHRNSDDTGVLNRFIPDEGFVELVYDSREDDTPVQS